MVGQLLDPDRSTVVGYGEDDPRQAPRVHASIQALVLGHHESCGAMGSILKLAGLALAVRLSTLALLLVLPHSGLVPAFDSSARAMGALQGLVRWDVLHFLSIYRTGGRAVEQQWAFGKAIRWVLVLGRSIVPGTLLNEEQAAVLGGSLLAIIASVGSTVILFLSVVIYPFFDG